MKITSYSVNKTSILTTSYRKINALQNDFMKFLFQKLEIPHSYFEHVTMPCKSDHRPVQFEISDFTFNGLALTKGPLWISG